MKCTILFIISSLTTVVAVAQRFNGSNDCKIRVVTETKTYEFRSADAVVAFDDVQDQIRLLIPAETIVAQNDTLAFSTIVKQGENLATLTLIANLPDDKDEQLDLSYFKGNRTIRLGGNVVFGDQTWKGDIVFKGMAVENNQKMIYDLQFFSPAITGKRGGVRQIEIAAMGDRIVGLTSN